MKPTECFAQLAQLTMIDIINPGTGLSQCYNENLEQIQARYPDAQRMTIDHFCERKAAAQDTPIEWQPTTEERFFDMLEVLPPAVHVPGGFLVGEATDHHARSGQPRYSGYCQRGQNYFVASRPLTVSEFRQSLLPDATIAA